MKRLCFIMYQFEVGGCESVFSEVAKAIDIEIDLVTSIPHLNNILIEKLPKNVRVIRHNDIPVLSTISKFRWPQKLLFIYVLISMVIIPRFLKKRYGQKRVIYVNFSDTLSSLYITIKAGGNNAISWLQCRPKALLYSRNLAKYLKCLKSCSKIVCICNAQKREFLKLFKGFKESQFEVIYNPIDYKRIEILKSEAIDVDSPYICMVSRLDKRSKDFHTAIKAYANLPSNVRNKYSLQIIGDGPDREELEQHINEMGLGKKIILRGADINPYKWMYNAEVFLFSSKNEGLGVVILEAMACNTLVIATDCPVGPAEILKENYDAGILVPMGDIEIMTRQISLVLMGEIEIEQYIKNANKRLEDFSVNRFRNRLFDLFKFNS